ncbi:uncharacterized protein LTR77_008984 [Saxophila tyrrhenica]|uniref:BTB domain-containing protein n=1 Tax=Saxophila tyrrhenica TaxID=1690608 RepID=A0AAV9NZ94_9PEZI|nr:hypothetical protein LTR77_008984 [Saxophila tyrrhenica]
MAIDPFRGQIAELFNQPRLSDFKVRCGEWERHLHKLVVCLQSKYFERALESGFKEAHEQVVELHEEDPNLVHLMLKWLYTRKYNIVDMAACQLPSLRIYAQSFAPAEKYFITGLKDFAVTKTRQLYQSDSGINGQFTGMLVDSIPVVYAMLPSTNSAMREAIVDVVFACKTTLFDANNTNSSTFRKVLRDPKLTGFAADVAERFARAS